MMMCLSLPSQELALQVLKTIPLIKEAKEKTNYCYNKLRKAHINIPKPSGGFFLFLNFNRNNPFRGLLNRGILTFPGNAFSQNFIKSVRINIMNDYDILDKALEEIISFANYDKDKH